MGNNKFKFAMQNSSFLAKRFFIVVVTLLFIGGCSIAGWLHTEKQEETPAQLMEEGIKNLKKGYYGLAVEFFQKIKDRYPYSKFAADAELKMADTLFKRKLYNEAIDSYKEFEKLHPKNPNIPYVIYHESMCHFNQMSTIDRDQSHTLQAREGFERLVKNYPNNKYESKARRKIRRCYINMAEYELYIGHFYYKKKKYRTAIGRYQYLLKNYPDLGQYNEALKYIRKCKTKIAEEKDKS